MTVSGQSSTGLYSPTLERDGFSLIGQMVDVASDWLVHTAIASLARLTHRGAVAADGESGDGCGLLLKLPEASSSIFESERKYPERLSGFSLTWLGHTRGPESIRAPI